MADDTKVDFYFYYHSNHLGSTNFVTRVAKSEDEDKPRHEMYEHVEYIPFGETWIEEREVLPFGGSKSNRYLFTSKEFDQETRLYYYGARYYDPKTSIWLSADPILDSYLDGKPNAGVFNSSNLNLYAYTAQNPVKFIDPTGLHHNNTSHPNNTGGQCLAPTQCSPGEVPSKSARMSFKEKLAELGDFEGKEGSTIADGPKKYNLFSWLFAKEKDNEYKEKVDTISKSERVTLWGAIKTAKVDLSKKTRLSKNQRLGAGFQSSQGEGSPLIYKRLRLTVKINKTSNRRRYTLEQVRIKNLKEIGKGYGISNAKFHWIKITSQKEAIRRLRNNPRLLNKMVNKLPNRKK